MKTDVKVLIVEDNVIIADDIQSTIENLGYTVLKNVISYEKAVVALNENNIDLVFIDINLATSKTGIDLANYINSNFKIPFIFLTSQSDGATIEKASKTNPYSYLVKPFDKNNLHASIEIAVKNHNSKKADIKPEEDFIFVKKGDLYCKIFFKDISYIKSDNVYLDIYCLKNEKYILRSTLKKFILKLPDYFYKCHKSYIINLNCISAFNKKTVIIKENEIPVSIEFRFFLKKFMS